MAVAVAVAEARFRAPWWDVIFRLEQLASFSDGVVESFRVQVLVPCCKLLSDGQG